MYYKLKKEARAFFDEGLSTEVKPLPFWEQKLIHINLLQQCGRAYIKYGHFEGPGTHLKGWQSNNGEPNAELKFTLIVNGVEWKDYDRLDVPELMDSLQELVDQHFDGTHGNR